MCVDGTVSLGNPGLLSLYSVNIVELITQPCSNIDMHCTGWPKKNNTETNQNDSDTNDISGTNFKLCKDIK